VIYIKNRNQLIENAQTPTLQRARFLALGSLESALNAADPKTLVHAKMKLNNNSLQVDNLPFDLSKFKHVYVMGGGKAGVAMAEATEEILGVHITAGVVNVPKGGVKKLQVIELHEATHPLPSQAGVEGTTKMMHLAETAGQDDLVICLISGGGSSLMPLPREGVSLQDKQALTTALLKSGAVINEINIVRKHLSAFKGGWLAKKAYPATVISLILSDVVGDSIDSIASGPTAADPSTFLNAQEILQKYSLWETASLSIRKALSDGAEGLVEETPKPDDPAFANVYNVLIGGNCSASRAAAEYLKSAGLKTIAFEDSLEGEARQMGKALAKCASKASAYDFSLPKPIGIVSGGETTVTVKGQGIGGRNQELALAAALNLDGAENCVLASLSTDGVDGPTDAAGALVDGYTIKRAQNLNLDAEKELTQNNSNPFFIKLGDLIITGPTGTNVNDISVIVIL
jgi:hydroxypyruvate reductase